MALVAEPDPDSFARALTALDGARFALDHRSVKVLRFMLEKPDGCDALLSAARFVIRFGWHSSRQHHYFHHTAPAIVSTLAELAVASPGVRAIRSVIGPGTIRTGFEPWRFDRRRLWLDASPVQLTIQVRRADQDHGDQAEPLSAPIEPVVQFTDLAVPLACPHCARPSSTYRRLSDGWLVCDGCGRSFPPT